MTAIKVSNVSKTFGKTRALDKVSLTVECGEMVALIGASGSGKSTLIRHIAGLEIADAGGGRIDVLGDLCQESGRLNRRLKRGRVSVIFQQFNLVGRLSVLTNVLIGHLGRTPGWRGTLGLFNRDEKHRAQAALERVGIPQVVAQRSSTLSGGQQQRAAIARTLVQEAEILIADEPISALDPSSARRVMDVLSDINARDGITVVVSLHQVEYARRYCPRTVAMRNGKIVYDGPSSALTNEFLAELYGAASEELVLPDAPAGHAAPAIRPALQRLQAQPLPA
ncbi:MULTISPECIES: phosphonate ABC transporter ATP-binding protein [unclassified Agrobacterium]|uniref:phosphonate ABC transporter ATP-binding protein n=1 Tax=unclassified Agrobacterium TaxID=2632611 RepID=UPI002449B7FC|nr:MULTISPECIES: phosphonate ABC transporter ATP-binding protein [unclassified Agrobacterium]MDH0615260.1 phosphonate ABC transporter ATP-binding protein [Agrobacterium sp. GD03872]MDH0698307.1 phosphonate ABC transporter ATP-binding protein [Agrobacterium sp. GD03871]MDH1060333.1 phosphonate ABC transporter ATP-binding protein [Agrobacterium sp. GD03992]MDH2212089.1 phosphonate ABC transporter ATP-binding protein [Agrobacterium sp. GD03643]MDH2220198.1 phosphonate ABC transporter ATP-binding 